ncbi:MAG TPA: hypothetical protein DD670_04640 [Planctomycetaceae bacterium]|nr:hypothetical protein [Planctomycetaceae bacterium]
MALWIVWVIFSAYRETDPTTAPIAIIGIIGKVYQRLELELGVVALWFLDDLVRRLGPRRFFLSLKTATNRITLKNSKVAWPRPSANGRPAMNTHRGE